MTSLDWYIAGFASAALIDVTVIVVAALVLWLRKRPQQDAPTPAAEPSPEPAEVDTEEGRVIDPTHPPYARVYRPRFYDQAAAPRCTCHGRPLHNGERVMIWPIKDHPDNGADLFCSETIAEAYEGVFPQ